MNKKILFIGGGVLASTTVALGTALSLAKEEKGTISLLERRDGVIKTMEDQYKGFQRGAAIVAPARILIDQTSGAPKPVVGAAKVGATGLTKAESDAIAFWKDTARVAAIKATLKATLDATVAAHPAVLTSDIDSEYTRLQNLYATLSSEKDSNGMKYSIEFSVAKSGDKIVVTATPKFTGFSTPATIKETSEFSGFDKHKTVLDAFRLKTDMASLMSAELIHTATVLQGTPKLPSEIRGVLNGNTNFITVGGLVYKDVVNIDPADVDDVAGTLRVTIHLINIGVPVGDLTFDFDKTKMTDLPTVAKDITQVTQDKLTQGAIKLLGTLDPKKLASGQVPTTLETPIGTGHGSVTIPVTYTFSTDDESGTFSYTAKYGAIVVGSPTATEVTTEHAETYAAILAAVNTAAKVDKDAIEQGIADTKIVAHTDNLPSQVVDGLNGDISKTKFTIKDPNGSGATLDVVVRYTDDDANGKIHWAVTSLSVDVKGVSTSTINPTLLVGDYAGVYKTTDSIGDVISSTDIDKKLTGIVGNVNVLPSTLTNAVLPDSVIVNKNSHDYTIALTWDKNDKTGKVSYTATYVKTDGSVATLTTTPVEVSSAQFGKYADEITHVKAEETEIKAAIDATITSGGKDTTKIPSQVVGNYPSTITVTDTTLNQDVTLTMSYVAHDDLGTITWTVGTMTTAQDSSVTESNVGVTGDVTTVYTRADTTGSTISTGDIDAALTASTATLPVVSDGSVLPSTLGNAKLPDTITITKNTNPFAIKLVWTGNDETGTVSYTATYGNKIWGPTELAGVKYATYADIFSLVDLNDVKAKLEALSNFVTTDKNKIPSEVTGTTSGTPKTYTVTTESIKGQTVEATIEAIPNDEDGLISWKVKGMKIGDEIAKTIPTTLQGVYGTTSAPVYMTKEQAILGITNDTPEIKDAVAKEGEVLSKRKVAHLSTQQLQSKTIAVHNIHGLDVNVVMKLAELDKNGKVGYEITYNDKRICSGVFAGITHKDVAENNKGFSAGFVVAIVASVVAALAVFGFMFKKFKRK